MRAVLAVLLAGLLMIGVVVSSPSAAAEGLTLSVGDQSGLERDSVTGSVFVPIYLSEPASEPVVVSYWTVDGTATAGVDYVRWGTPASPRTVTIPAGAVQTQVNVPILVDDDVEGDETFSVVASATGGGVVVGDDTGTATIVDADALSGFNPVITVSSPTVVEGDSDDRRAQFLIHLSRAPLSPVAVTYNTADGAAVAGEDFVAKLPGTVVFAPGQISKTIDVLVTPNTDVDGTRDFALQVAVTGGSPVEEITMTGVATIIDDDTAAAVPCAPGTFNSTDGNEPCEPAPAGTYVDTSGALAATPCAPGSFQDQAGQTSCQLAPIGSYVEFSGATSATLCPAGTTTNATGSTSPADCVPAGTVMDSSAGDLHTCAVLDDGTAMCWGLNVSGQLGDGTSTDSNVPVAVTGLTNATATAAGNGHSCALIGDGTVSCWGRNTSGQLGNGTTTDSSVPVPVTGITTATAVDVGNDFSCALLANGTVQCWGLGSSGQLGNGSNANSAVPVTVQLIGTATELASGAEHSCALEPDKSEVKVRCWGRNSWGQLGNSTGVDSNISVPVFINDATSVSAGWNQTCARRAGGNVSCWGATSVGTSTVGSFEPTEVPGLTGVADVTIGAGARCALLVDDTVRCWGRNISGQLGNGTTIDSSTPVTVTGLSDATAVDFGTSHVCALRVGGTVSCWGNNDGGQLGNGGRSSDAPDSTVPVAVPGISDAVALSVGSDHSCSARSSGSVYCWGRNSFGKLGNGKNADSGVPVAVLGITNATAVAAGAEHSCALKGDGTVSCWGKNSWGQLGNGNNATSSGGSDADSAVPVAVMGITNATAVAAGAEHSCALKGDGTVSCWGRNTYGQLGNGTTTDSNVPVAVTGINSAIAVDVSFRDGTSCALLGDGAVYCWGRNNVGQLGDNGINTNSSIPIAVAGLTDAIAVTTGGSHSCAVRADGSVSCWGQNASGQLGTGTATDHNIPVLVTGIANAAAITAGFDHTCAVLGDGTGSCWGSNSNGQLGTGTTTSSSVPATVTNLTNATRIHAGLSHSCSLLGDATLTCWGSNFRGQLGNYVDAGSLVPSPVVGLS